MLYICIYITLEALSRAQKAKHTLTILKMSILKVLDKLWGKLILYRFLFIKQKQQALYSLNLEGNKKNATLKTYSLHELLALILLKKLPLIKALSHKAKKYLL